MKMTANDWKRELHRLLELFERESTISLKEIKRQFDMSGLPFDENFRKYFMKMSTHRLDASFNTVLYDQLNENRMNPNAQAPSDDSEVEDHTLSVGENEDRIEPKMEIDADDPIEMADSDDKGGGEQQVNDSIGAGQIEVNGLPRFNNEDEYRDGEYNGSIDLSSGNEIEVDVKREIKEEHLDQLVLEDLPLVEFDPIKANETTSDPIVIAAPATLNSNQKQSSPASKVQKQFKHDAGKRRLKCTNCTFACKYKSHLDAHLKIHGSVKPFKCVQCDYACRRKDHLEKHQKVHVKGMLVGTARDPTDGLYKCTQCDQRFTGIGCLGMHLKQTHKDNQRLYNCECCLRRFASAAEKESHEIQCQKRHYECYLCKTYVHTMKSHMQEHMRTHSGGKPFECAVCNRCFRYKYNLKRHSDSAHGHKCK